MFHKHRWLLALVTALFFFTPLVHAQALSVACTNPIGPSSQGAYNSMCIASGGAAPYAYVIDGQLPAGLSAQIGAPGDGHLTITGTPLALGPYSYTIQFTDSQNRSGSQAFSGTVSNACTLYPRFPPLPQTLSFGPSGGTFGLSLRFLSQGCPWTLSSDVPGVTITRSSGITNALTVASILGFAANPDATPHLGNVILREAGVITQTMPFTVNSASCSYSLNPSSVHLGSAGGAGMFKATANPSNCTPAVLLYPSFIPGSANLGEGFTYAVGTNFGAARSGSIVIGSGSAAGPNASFLITQDGNDGNGAFVLECPLTGTPRVGRTFPAICYASGGMEPYSWSIDDSRLSVPNFFSFPATTAISAVGGLLTLGHYHFRVTITDSSLPSPKLTTYTFDGTTQPALPSFTCSSTAGFWQAGSGFGFGCTATGGTPPYQWSITSGAPPAGVFLSAAPGGVAISGVPSAAGDFIITLQLTDSANPDPSVISQVIGGTIVPTGPLPTPVALTCVAGPGGFASSYEVGVPAPAYQCTAAGGVPPYQWSIHSGSLPAGLALSTPVGNAVGIIGTPTMNGVDSFFLKVTDGSATPQSTIAGLTYTVAAPLAITNCPAGPSALGELYSVQCVPTGGVSSLGYSYSWWVSAGALPSGISLSNTNGVFIAGTPTTPGPYNYTISVADNLTPMQATASQTFTGVVTPLPAPLDTANISGSMAHLAIGDGWSTATVLMNPSANYAQAHVGYFGDGGSPLLFLLSTSTSGALATASSADQIMAAHSMFEVDSSAQPSDPLQEGSANLSTDGDVNGFIRFRYAPRDQDATVPLETRKAGAYLLSFDNTNGIATGVALASLGANTANVPVVMRDDTGAQIGSASLPLTGKGHTAFVLSDKFPNLANQSGTLEFDTPAGGRISVLGLRFPPGQQFTTIPVIASADAGGGALAHLAVGNGWTSTVELVNFGATTAQAHLKFFGDDGSPLPLAVAFATTTATTSTVDRPMAAHSRLVIQSTALDSDPLQIGSAQLTTDGSVSGFIRFRYGPRNQEAIVPIESRNSSSYIVAFDNTGGLAAGVAVANLSANAVTLPVLIRDRSGAQLGSGVVTLAANGHSAFVLSDQFVAAANQTGTIEFDAPAGSQITVLGLRFPASGAFSTIPVVTP